MALIMKLAISSKKKVLGYMHMHIKGQALKCINFPRICLNHFLLVVRLE